MHFVTKILLVIALTKTASSVPIESDGSARIVNGFNVDISQVPYQAALQRRVVIGWTHHCGAVILSNRIILSAAHCTTSYSVAPSSLRVMVGTSSRLSGGTAYDVLQVISHEQFSPVTMMHDISMLITASPIAFSDNVSPVAIAPTNMVLPAGSEAIVSGFGVIAYEGTAPSSLLAARVQIIEQATCALAYIQITAIREGMICAAGVDPPRDACQGDSGGPLVVNDTLIGIVSWGEGCADVFYPGVYTRISEYRSWIIDTSSGLV